MRALVRRRRLLHPRRLAAVAALLLAGAVAVLLVDMLEGVAAKDVASAVHATRGIDLLAAGFATAGSYAALIGFEWLALRQAGAAVSPRLAVFTGFISWAFTFVLGFGVVTGGAVRLRRYGRAGLTARATIAVTLFGAVFFWLGIAGLAGISLIAAPGVLTPLVGLPAEAGLALGLGVTLAIGAWIARGGRTLRLGGQALTLPTARTGAAVVALGIADTGLAALGLWFVLPAGSDMTFLAFLPIFAMATVAGVLSHAPGGVGAFEAVILISVPGAPSALLAALLVFRLVYYVAPFGLAAIAFAVAELAPQRNRLSALPMLLVPLLRPLAPLVLSTAVFGLGLLLLISGAVPSAAWRMSGISAVLPLPFVEASHFVASVAGAALLIVASGLKRQMRASWVAALALLAAEAVVSLAKGFDFEEAAACVVLMVALIAARGAFDRGGSALQAVSVRRIAGIAAAIALSIAVGLVARGDVDWEGTHWWEFAVQSDAPRFLRASVGASVVLALLLLWRATHIAIPNGAEAPCAGRIAAAVAGAPDPNANLAFLGDKRFLFDEDGGFIMYQVQRGTYLAMGDPVTRCRAATARLVWRFRELAHRNGGVPAFYQVSAATLPVYIEAGFAFAKLGEEAVVDLAAFTMSGSRATRFRQMTARAERADLTFEIVPAGEVAPLAAALRPISDAWLERQAGREKGFSVGFWSEAYLARFDHALVRHAGTPVAFATLWRCGRGEDVTIDLMRHGPDLPNGTMDFLFVALINALKAEGVARLSLGMAPLAGLAEHRLAPAWSRVGATVYRRGGAFYNFSGLRDYKAKFKPEWRPRYLAHTGARSVARVMIDATWIVSRGPRGLEGEDTAEDRTAEDRAAEGRAA
ncbi:bifunctional lysylphosphatidylglycerol flippase/synthetase MprF [Acuticoccus sp. I52.16.1]|uniref:bifunctional lysylphosphatidylglycerol flippase/synthetase MprF n=1 Tax=Acuticoccus sp. I52.16.1 TaxID=2928472 RepID=UPI001FD51E9F|nr:bifunctional lysylphosphatidylglycerol flippase/synthetase MprF [Acuticoccus sp. I52.16.1]UOM33293.1 bifunctional lysylphosphatidylglycerol flippase/synthetase MprF [Acuticoccus sp. I52.16.1]